MVDKFIFILFINVFFLMLWVVVDCLYIIMFIFFFINVISSVLFLLGKFLCFLKFVVLSIFFVVELWMISVSERFFCLMLLVMCILINCVSDLNLWFILLGFVVLVMLNVILNVWFLGKFMFLIWVCLLKVLNIGL